MVEDNNIGSLTPYNPAAVAALVVVGMCVTIPLSYAKLACGCRVKLAAPSAAVVCGWIPPRPPKTLPLMLVLV